MVVKLSLALLLLGAFTAPLSAQQDQPIATSSDADVPQVDSSPATSEQAPIATSIDLKEVFESPSTAAVLPQVPPRDSSIQQEAEAVASRPTQSTATAYLLDPKEILKNPNTTRRLLETEIPPATATRLIWKPSPASSGMAVETPILVVNGANDGPTLCLTAAVHGDELNGIEMVRRVMYDLDPHKLHGMIIGVPIVNLLGFSRNSRYLPDRRDLNRYFPGNEYGSVASRIAHAFFNDIVRHCDKLVDLHTGSFYRTNIPQLRADMNNPQVASFVELFGDIPVLNSRGNSRSLRAAAVRAGIPTVTLEAGEPMRMQREMVKVGVKAINTLMAKSGMYSKLGLWVNPAPAFYDSAWVRANASGILFSRMELGDEVEEGDILGAVNNPISNEQIDIISPHTGRILGMALDQFVMPGFAVYHIGIHASKGMQMAAGGEDPDDYDDDDDIDDTSGTIAQPETPDGRPTVIVLDEDSFDDE